MKKKILNLFTDFRSNIIKVLFDYVGKNFNKKILLDDSFVDIKIDDGHIVKNIYKMLIIEKNTLFVRYLSGKGDNIAEYEDCTDDIVLFSLDEIYNIAKNIKESANEEKYFCENCGEKAKVYRMFDIDGTNLVEALVCLNCRDGELSTKTT